MTKITHKDTKHGEKCDFEPHDCGIAGKYQELKSLGGFSEVTDGSRVQRLHQRNYHKDHLGKKSKGPLEDLLSEPDTRGPPMENISVPKRIL